jgi:2-amino-4-hydroxy-6-hydroxymethyldihydropteridine diphosphokinase
LISPILITLGSNIEPEKHLRLAIQKLAEDVTVRAVSRVYESPAINAAGEVNLAQGAFLNAAAWIETELLPQDLKFDVLRRIESEMGRVRTSISISRCTDRWCKPIRFVCPIFPDVPL